MRITFLCPHVRIAGGVRAILTYADRLAGRGHRVTVLVPAHGRLRALGRRLRGVRPDWLPSFRARIEWVTHWSPEWLPPGDVIVATAWQSAPIVAAAPAPAGRKFYLVQHYESLYHGDATTVDATYRLPLQTIVISTWLRDVLRERFGRDAEILVTPVDRALFHPVAAEAGTMRPRVLMLHHDYAWKGVPDGLEAIARVKNTVPSVCLVGFGVKPPRERDRYDEFHENPAQDRLAALYSSADIYLCPSWDEGLGMPPMEAMACGAALVTYDNGGWRGFLPVGGNPLVAARGGVGALLLILHPLSVGFALRARTAAEASPGVGAAVFWDRAVERMEKIFTG